MTMTTQENNPLGLVLKAIAAFFEPAMKAYATDAECADLTKGLAEMLSLRGAREAYTRRRMSDE